MKVRLIPPQHQRSKKENEVAFKGSKNKDKSRYTLSNELFRIKGMLEALLSTIGDTIPLKYLLLDGKFGHHNAAQMALHIGLHCKLSRNFLQT